MQKKFVIAAFMKKFIKVHDGMNTSALAIEKLDEHNEKILKIAIDKAQRDGRKTVMDRDIESAIIHLSGTIIEPRGNVSIPKY